MPQTSSPARLGQVYHAWRREHPTAAQDFKDAIEDLLDDSGVTYDRVTSRVKTWRSFKAKALSRTADGTPRYNDPWNDIRDLVGVRITTYHSTAIPEVINVLRQSFKVVKSVDKAAQTKISGGFGYGSHHLYVEIPSGIEGLEEYAGMLFEVQIRTVLQHAWAEFEHDVRYKSGDCLDPRVDRAFTLAAGLIELADQQFDQIATIHGDTPDHGSDVELTAETLPGVLTVLVGNRFPTSKIAHYTWMEELLSAHGITTLAQLRNLLDDAAIADVHTKMQYRFVPSQLRLIDDLLLRTYGEEHIEKTAKTGNRAQQRPERLRGRLAKLHKDS